MNVAGTRLDQPGHGGRRTHVHPLLEHPEVGETFLVQGDHLAVDEQVAPGQRGDRQIGPGGCDIVAVPAQKSVETLPGVGEHPDAVPLHLMGPPVTCGDVAAGRGQHGAQATLWWSDEPS